MMGRILRFLGKILCFINPKGLSKEQEEERRKLIDDLIGLWKKIWQVRADRVLLFLNYCSNNYGVNWLQAVLFTIIISLLFWTPLWCLVLKEKSSLNFFSAYLKYLLPVGAFPENLNTLGYALSILGRITVSYGIYQTVAAFRRLR